MIAVGLMSGTSLDGIDAALVKMSPRGVTYGVELLKFLTVPFDEELHAALRAALPPNTATVPDLARLHRSVGSALARAARQVAGALRVDYVASHGQTIWHDGEAQITLQIGDPFVIREALNATVCFDFRSADCAVGGHGAPLVPYIDGLLFSDRHEDRASLNIGGIANVTFLPASVRTHDVMAFDTGPGNMLIDAFVRERTNGAMTIDREGAFAAAGAVDESLLSRMLEEPYFDRHPPKSTGRERFGAQFLRAYPALAALSLEDGAATLTELTAASVAAALSQASALPRRLIVSGGGVYNHELMRRLQKRLPDVAVETSDAHGIPAEAKEAIAFAMLGYETLRERAANVPRVTGASRAVPLGAIAPVRLAELLSEVERECRSS